MSLKQMEDRGCSDSKMIGIAKLEGYDLVFCGKSPNWEMKGTANLEKVNNREVWGALFEVDNRCLDKLDKFEHVPSRRKRQIVQVVDQAQKKHDAVVYILKTDLEINQPSEAYFQRVVESAKSLGLPSHYIEFIEKQKRPG